MTGPFDLRGRVAVVAGCSPSINAGIALALARHGADVACLDRREDLADAAAAAVRATGVAAASFVADVTDEVAIVSTVNSVVDRLGRIDIVVNGAAIETWHGALDCTLAELRAHFEIIVGGAFLLSTAAARHMIANNVSGSIINLASTEAHQGRPGNFAYGVAKGAILHMTRCLAMELAPHRIRVNSLTPTGTDSAEGVARAQEWGVDWTPASAPRRPDFSRGDGGIPLGRRPSPSDYGHAAAFLASPAAAMITGTDLRVDGGVVGRYWRWSPGADATNEETSP
jgi:3-oxoacyl-[acyl-carrier protein] reductase